jgi:hypothetical protein
MFQEKRGEFWRGLCKWLIYNKKFDLVITSTFPVGFFPFKKAFVDPSPIKT